MRDFRLSSGAVGLARATDVSKCSPERAFLPKNVVSKNHFRLFCKNIIGDTHLILDEIQLNEGNWQGELKKYHS